MVSFTGLQEIVGREFRARRIHARAQTDAALWRESLAVAQGDRERGSKNAISEEDFRSLRQMTLEAEDYERETRGWLEFYGRELQWARANRSDLLTTT